MEFEFLRLKNTPPTVSKQFRNRYCFEIWGTKNSSLNFVLFSNVKVLTEEYFLVKWCGQELQSKLLLAWNYSFFFEVLFSMKNVPLSDVYTLIRVHHEGKGTTVDKITQRNPLPFFLCTITDDLIFPSHFLNFFQKHAQRSPIVNCPGTGRNEFFTGQFTKGF